MQPRTLISTRARARTHRVACAPQAEEGTCKRKVGGGDVFVSSMCTISSSHALSAARSHRQLFFFSICSNRQLRCPTTKKKTPYSWVSRFWMRSSTESWLTCERAHPKSSSTRVLGPQVEAKVSRQQSYLNKSNNPFSICLV